jgi:hypothetical protein
MVSDIDVTLKAEFPELPATVMQRTRREVYQTMLNTLAESGVDMSDPMNLPDDFPERVQGALVEAIKAERVYMYELRGPQAKANEEARGEAPLDSGGHAARPAPKTMKGLSEDGKRAALGDIVDSVFDRFKIRR